VARKNYKLSDEEFAEIIKINKEGGDRVMYLGGGLPLGSGEGGRFRSKQEKINDYWKKLSKKNGFDAETISPINDREFSAEMKEKGLQP
jgi:hypothetical protein